MRKKMWIVMALILVIPGLLLTVSCAKKAVKKDALRHENDRRCRRKSKASGAGTAAEARRTENGGRAPRRLNGLKKLGMMFENSHVYFAYDSSVLDDMAQSTLKSKADWLRENPASRVLIGGHCDERGTIEYNLALGDRRAESAKRFLMSLGIDGSRLTTVSYGEERPLESGTGEAILGKKQTSPIQHQVKYPMKRVVIIIVTLLLAGGLADV